MTPDPAATIPAGPAAVALNARQSSAWDIANAPRNYISLVLTQGAGAAFSFASVWLITNYLGSEGYGGIVAVIAASQVAQVFVNWTAIAVVRFGVDEFIVTAKIARTFWVRLAALAINLLIVIAASIFWFPPLANWLKLSPETYWLVLAHFTLAAIWTHIQMSLQGAKMLRLQGILMMIERLLIMAGIIGLLAAASLTGTTAILCYIAAPTAMIVAGIVAVRRYIFSRFSAGAPFVRKLFDYSLPLLLMGVVGYVASVYVDAIFISNYLSTSDLGVYSVATQINGVVLQIPTLANTLLLPLFVTLSREDQTARLQKFFDRVLPVLMLIWGLTCTLFAFAASFAVPLVFRPEFVASVMPLWILLVSTAVALPSLLGYQAMAHSISATSISLWAVIAAAIAKIALNFILIPELGIVGCAWATVIAFVVAVVVAGLRLRRHILIRLSWTFAAMTPVLLGGLAGWLTSNLWLSLGVSLLATTVLAFYFRDAVNDAVSFIRYLRKRTV